MKRWVLVLYFAILVTLNCGGPSEAPVIQDVAGNSSENESPESVEMTTSISNISQWPPRKSDNPKFNKQKIWKDIQRELRDMKKMLPGSSGNTTWMEDLRDMNRNFFSIVGDIRFIKNEVMFIKQQANVIYENLTDARRDHTLMNNAIWWILGNMTSVIDDVEKSTRQMSEISKSYEEMSKQMDTTVNRISEMSGVTGTLKEINSEFGQIKRSMNHGTDQMSTEINVVRDIVGHLAQTIRDVQQNLQTGFIQIDGEMTAVQSRILADMAEIANRVSNQGNAIANIIDSVTAIARGIMDFAAKISEIWNMIGNIQSNIDEFDGKFHNVDKNIHLVHEKVSDVDDKVLNFGYKLGDIHHQMDDMSQHLGVIGNQFIGLTSSISHNFDGVNIHLVDVHDRLTSNVSSIKGDLDEVKIHLRDIRQAIVEKCETASRNIPLQNGIIQGQIIESVIPGVEESSSHPDRINSNSGLPTVQPPIDKPLDIAPVTMQAPLPSSPQVPGIGINGSPSDPGQQPSQTSHAPGHEAPPPGYMPIPEHPSHPGVSPSPTYPTPYPSAPMPGYQPIPPYPSPTGYPTLHQPYPVIYVTPYPHVHGYLPNTPYPPVPGYPHFPQYPVPPGYPPDPAYPPQSEYPSHSQSQDRFEPPNVPPGIPAGFPGPDVHMGSGVPLPLVLPPGPEGPGLPIAYGNQLSDQCVCSCPCDCSCPTIQEEHPFIKSRYDRVSKYTYRPYSYLKHNLCQCLCSCPCSPQAIRPDGTHFTNKPVTAQFQRPLSPGSPVLNDRLVPHNEPQTCCNTIEELAREITLMHQDMDDAKNDIMIEHQLTRELIMDYIAEGLNEVMLGIREMSEDNLKLHARTINATLSVRSQMNEGLHKAFNILQSAVSGFGHFPAGFSGLLGLAGWTQKRKPDPLKRVSPLVSDLRLPDFTLPDRLRSNLFSQMKGRSYGRPKFMNNRLIRPLSRPTRRPLLQSAGESIRRPYKSFIPKYLRQSNSHSPSWELDFPIRFRNSRISSLQEPSSTVARRMLHNEHEHKNSQKRMKQLSGMNKNQKGRGAKSVSYAENQQDSSDFIIDEDVVIPDNENEDQQIYDDMRSDDQYDPIEIPDALQKIPNLEENIPEEPMISNQFHNLLQKHINDRLAKTTKSGGRNRVKGKRVSISRSRTRNRNEMGKRPKFPMLHGFPFIRRPTGWRPPMAPMRQSNPSSMRTSSIPKIFGSRPPGMMVTGTNGAPYSFSYSDGAGNFWNNVNRRNNVDDLGTQENDWQDSYEEHEVDEDSDVLDDIQKGRKMENGQDEINHKNP